MRTRNKAAVRELFVDSPRSIGGRMRARRARWFESTFPNLGSFDVVDFGGRADTWTSLSTHPRSVTLVNIEPVKQPPDTPWITIVSADILAPSFSLDRDFDLAYSNSVIEHVGGHQNANDFAQIIRESAPRYWVQTPYRYFPIEPHFLLPFGQFLPVPVAAKTLTRWPLGWAGGVSSEHAVSTVLGTRLLSKTEFRHYFPDAEHRFERIIGIPKSMLAVRS